MSQHLLTWAPRVLGVVIALFLSLFALDSLGTDPHALRGTLIHLLPALLVGLVVAVGWRLPAIGAIGFAALAFTYAGMARYHLNWILVVSGPLALTGLLFGASAIARQRTRTT